MKFFPLFAANILNHFEVALYSAFAPLLIEAFFNNIAYKNTVFYGLFWVSALVAYPLGAWFFALMARKKTDNWALKNSIKGSICSTFLMGCIPLFPSLWMGPGILWVLRTMQCLCAQGQRFLSPFSLLETQKFSSRILAICMYEGGTLLGLLLASLAANQALCRSFSGLWWWRGAYYIAAAGHFIILYMLPQDPPMKKILSHESKTEKDPLGFQKHLLQWATKALRNFFFPTGGLKSPMGAFLWRGQRCALFFLSAFGYLPYSLAFQVLNVWAPKVCPLDTNQLMTNNSYLLLFDFAAIGMCAWVLWALHRNTSARGGMFLCKKQGHLPLTSGWPLMRFILLCWVFIPIPMLSLLPVFPTLLFITIIRVFCVITGVFYGFLLTIWLKECKEMGVSYTTIASYGAFGVAILGRSGSFWMLASWDATHWAGSVGLYPGCIALLGICAIHLLQHAQKKTSQAHHKFVQSI